MRLPDIEIVAGLAFIGPEGGGAMTSWTANEFGCKSVTLRACAEDGDRR